MSAGTRRDGSSEFGPFTRNGAPYHEDSAYYYYNDGAAYDEDAVYADAWDAAADSADDVDAADEAPQRDRPGFGSDRRIDRSRPRARRYAGRHATSRRKTARIRARKAVPAVVVAAAFAAGAAAYTLAGSGQPQAAQLNAMMSGPLILRATAHAGQAETAASAMLQATKTPGTASRRVPASRAASSKPSASHAKAAAGASTSPTAIATATAGATPTASTSSPSAAALSCNLSYVLLPDNVTAIVSFLLANGYSDNAAAGIAGNIYQESKGDPESIGMGGGGLIGWTPLPSGFVTGDPEADLQTQLAAILTYNQQWSSYLPALNSAASPSDAAYIYVTYFERAGIPAAATREASAENVASACGI